MLNGPGTDLFGFDGTGPWGGNYLPPDGSASFNINNSDDGDVLFTNPVGPGGVRFFGLEDDGAGVLANTTLTATAVPEPASLVLLGVGLLGLGLARRRRG